MATAIYQQGAMATAINQQGAVATAINQQGAVATAISQQGAAINQQGAAINKQGAVATAISQHTCIFSWKLCYRLTNILLYQSFGTILLLISITKGVYIIYIIIHIANQCNTPRQSLFLHGIIIVITLL